LLTAESARREAILAALDDLSAHTSPDDTAIVYFSGHGYRVASLFGTMHYLLPYGYDIASLPATAICGQDLAQKLLDIGAGKLRVPWVKGGSWWDESGYVKVSSRLRYHPRDWFNSGGFRVVIVPISHDNE
jgi:hypothetical protein